MEKNRLFIIISAAVAILALSCHGQAECWKLWFIQLEMAFAEMDGLLLSSQSLRLSCLLERCKTSLPKVLQSVLSYLGLSQLL